MVRPKRSLKLLRYGAIGLFGALLLGILACGGGDNTPTPQPTPTPLDVGQITSAVQQGLEQTVMDAVKAAVPTAPEPLSQAELQQMVEAAVTASILEGVSAAEIKSIVDSTVMAATKGAATTEDVARLVTAAVTQAAKDAPEPLAADDVKRIVEQAIRAIPTATPAPTVTPAPTPTPVPAPTATPAVMMKKEGIRGGNPPLQMGWVASHWDVTSCANPNTCLVPFAPLYNGILEYNPESDDQIDLRGDLAKSWTLGNDGLTYTFKLHEYARFMDGSPVTATDVKFSFDDATTEPVWPNVRGMGSFYDSARVVDANTVEIKTKFQAAPFLLYVASEYMKIVSKDHVEKARAAGNNLKLKENINGSGPFRLKEHQKDVKIVYERNPVYFKENRPYWDSMTYFVILDAGAITAAFKSGRALTHAHATNNLSGAQNSRLHDDMKGIGKVYWAGPTAILWNTLQLQKAPFNDVRVRKAFHLTADRQAMIQIFSQGRDSLGAPFPPGFWFGYSEEELLKLPGYRVGADGQKHPDDIAEAKRLLTEAGLKDGFKVELKAGKLIEWPDLAVLQKDQWETSLGASISITLQEYATNFADRQAGNYQIAMAGYSQGVMDPHDLLAGCYILGGRANFADWTVPRIEEIYKLQSGVLDREERKKLIDEAADIMLFKSANGDTPYIWHYWTFRGMFVSDQIKNFHVPAVDSTQLKMEHMWCDPAC
jgi:peptide/nickel transport system substrate-binding protein